MRMPALPKFKPFDAAGLFRRQPVTPVPPPPPAPKPLSAAKSGREDADSEPLTTTANIGNNGDSASLPAGVAMTDKEKALVSLMQARLRESSDAKRPHLVRYKDALSFYKGNQWGQYGEDGRYKDMRDIKNRSRVYATHNKIRNAARKHIARELATKSDIQVSPLTPLSIDRDVAKQSRAVLGHLEEVLDLERKWLQARIMRVVYGPVFHYVWFDAETVVPFPILDDNAQLESVEDVKLGELNSVLLTAAHVSPDPKGLDLRDECEWVIISRRRPLSYFVRRFGNRGKMVTPDSNSAVDNDIDLLENVSDSGRNLSRNKGKTATEHVMYEQPSDDYPEGRFVMMAGGVILQEPSVFPYPDLKHPTIANRYLFPVHCCPFEGAIDSFWGDNAISPLIEVQRSRNRVISKVSEHIRKGDGKWFVDSASNVKPTALTSGERDEMVVYDGVSLNGGREPFFVQTPPLDRSLIEAIRIFDQDFAEMSEVQGVDMGREPFAGASGATIQSLQEASSSTATISGHFWKAFLEDFAHIALGITRAGYHTDRLLYVKDTDDSGLLKKALMKAAQTPQMPPEVLQAMMQNAPMGAGQNAPIGAGQNAPPGAGQGTPPPPGMPGVPPPPPGMAPPPEAMQAGMPGMQAGMPQDEEDNPYDKARTQVFNFQRFAEGRIKIEVGVSSSKTPAQRIQMVLDMAKAGMFIPEAIPTTIATLQMMDMEAPDKLTDDLIAALQLIQDRQDAQQAQMASQAQSVQEQKTQGDIQAKTMQAQIQSQTAQTKAQLDAELQKLKASSEAQSQASKAQTEAQAQMEIDRNRHELEVEQMQLKAMTDAHTQGAGYAHDRARAIEQARMDAIRQEAKAAQKRLGNTESE